MSKTSHQSGFTLIETLVALAIVALSFAVLFKIISDNLDRTRRVQDQAVAASLLQSLLARTEFGALSPGVTRGRYANGFNWRLRIEPYSLSNADRWPVAAMAVAATVSWQEDNRAQSRTLMTLRVVPKAMP